MVIIRYNMVIIRIFPSVKSPYLCTKFYKGAYYKNMLIAMRIWPCDVYSQITEKMNKYNLTLHD